MLMKEMSTNEMLQRIESLEEENYRLREKLIDNSRVIVELEKLLHEKYHILEGITDGLVAVDHEWRYIYINAATYRFLSKEKEEVIGKKITDYYPQYAEPLIAIKNRGKKCKLSAVLEEYSKQNDRWHEVLIYAVSTGYLFFFRDITSRKKAEEALIRSEERFRKVFQKSPLSKHVLKLSDLTIVAVNDSFEEVTGYSRGEVIGNKCEDLAIADKPDNLMELEEKLLQYERFDGLELNITTKAGEKRTMLCSAMLIEFNDEPCVLISSEDITERKRFEEDLRLSEERFRMVFLESPIPLCVVDTDSKRILAVNRSFENTSGYLREEMIGKTAVDLDFYYDLEDRNGSMNLLGIKGRYQNLEIKLSRKSGETMVALISAESITIQGRRCFLFQVNDITEKKRLEQELLQLARLNVIGQMSAGIGHEIRNPLTCVRGYLQFLKARNELAIYQDHFDVMIDEIDRANGIITEFLSISKKSTSKKELKNINEIIRKLEPLLQADGINSKIEVSFQLDQNIEDLMVDEKEIRQLILNLFRNGVDAMSEGGTMVVKTLKEDQNLLIIFQDQGPGIPEEILKNIGVPFFTTKENGTGLGLAVCYGIAARHNGTIQFDTSPHGTTVTVRLKRLYT
ncbi:PAS domain S-box protein [Heliorestis convoluta]|uniref:histidine kinase n=1 Tax=Heliorestis convoluta TaxID=356322 RepID=A0A5Q2MZQ5_9FIRM|nr:PAS domain S-box protein [Heliorestis convoluta]QGG48474.1 PAS/PAC sensor signal transduction histidine kinase [Heliorestis convoluta]